MSMVTKDEIEAAEYLLTETTKLRTLFETARESADERKLTTVSSEWPKRVESLRKCVSLLGDIERLVTEAYS